MCVCTRSNTLLQLHGRHAMLDVTRLDVAVFPPSYITLRSKLGSVWKNPAPIATVRWNDPDAQKCKVERDVNQVNPQVIQKLQNSISE